MSAEKKEKECSLEEILFTSDKARMKNLVADILGRARESVGRAVSALLACDIEAARGIVARDDEIDDLEEQIDQECLYTIAMRQPMREDLRFVYAVMKIVTDIERVGDESVNICLGLKHLLENGGVASDLPRTERIREAASLCLTMCDTFLAAFNAENGGALPAMKERREEVTGTYLAVCREILRGVASGGERATVGAFVSLNALRHLKRIADHLLNLGEKVYFIETGISPMTLKKRKHAMSDEEAYIRDAPGGA